MPRVLGKTSNGWIRVEIDGRECVGCPGSLLATREIGIFTSDGQFVAVPVASDIMTRQLVLPMVGGQFLTLWG